MYKVQVYPVKGEGKSWSCQGRVPKRSPLRETLQNKGFAADGFGGTSSSTWVYSATHTRIFLHPYFLVAKFFVLSGKKKARELLTHKLFEKAVNPGTTSWLTRRKCLFSCVQRRAHKLFCPVNGSVVSGSTGPRPEQKVYVYVPFSLPILLSDELRTCRSPSTAEQLEQYTTLVEVLAAMLSNPPALSK